MESPSSSCSSCSVCHRQIAVTAAGWIRQHGPVSARCQGSRQPPALSVQSDHLSSAASPILAEVSAPDSAALSSLSLPPRPTVKILKYLPKASRESAGKKLASILGGVVSKNDHASWTRLLRFSSRCLRHPGRGGRHWSLASCVNRQLNEEADPQVTVRPRQRGRKAPKDDVAKLAERVSEKLEDGDFKGAVRLASSDSTLAPMNESTYQALLERHPSPHPDSLIPPIDDEMSSHAITVDEGEVIQAIRSFKRGSAGGPDGLRPQHLKDMISVLDCCQVLVPALTAFVHLVLEGKTPPSIRPFFFGANLTALQKKDGGVRPIAVGCTLRRLVAKLAGHKIMEEMGELLAPRQLGYGVRGGAESAVHAARLYLQDLDPSKAILKLDFKNAFNSIHRDKVLAAVLEHAHSLYPFLHSVYSSPSSLFWGDRILQSSEGVQQGDPLGPLMFCLCIHHMVSELQSELSFFYLDDGTLGGSEDCLCHDLEVVERVGSSIGLVLNTSKTEIICSCPETTNTILSSLPSAKVVSPSQATLLGSSIGDVASITNLLHEKTAMLRRMGDRLQHLSSHDAILLLRHSFALPKLLYNLRTTPCFLSPALQEYDSHLMSIVSTITNIHFGESDPAWLQATLPVKMGGLGIRNAVQLAPSAFLASAAATSDLVHQIVPTVLQGSPIPNVEDAMAQWSDGLSDAPPEGVARYRQKVWDTIKTSASAEHLLKDISDPRARARLLASRTKESGAWLNVLPISSLGLRMDDNTIRIAVGLRLGVPLCRPHSCQHCGAEVDSLATHGLSCRWSEGRHHRHAALNNIIHRALSSAKIPSRLEPSGLQRSDGKRPDGITVVPWKCGKLLVWDATCPDTFAPSYISSAASEAGLVAASAEERKEAKYIGLGSLHSFTPVAIETSGVFGPKSLLFVRELGRRLTRVTGDVRSPEHLLQRLSVAVQRGNSAAVMGTAMCATAV